MVDSLFKDSIFGRYLTSFLFHTQLKPVIDVKFAAFPKLLKQLNSVVLFNGISDLVNDKCSYQNDQCCPQQKHVRALSH